MTEAYEIKITESEDNFKTCTDNLKNENRKFLYEKDVLILPKINYGSIEKNLYHEDVMDFIEYINEQEQNINYGLCSDEEEILSLNDAGIWLGDFLIKASHNPIFINILSCYLYDKFIKRGKNPQVKFSMKVVEAKGGKSKTFNYECDAQTFQKIAPKLIKEFKNVK